MAGPIRFAISKSIVDTQNYDDEWRGKIVAVRIL